MGIGIAEVIEAYKADFARIDEDERYKWQAIKWYKDHWNIDAQDFAAMFTSAFSKASNLLASNMYYPYKMICQFSEMHPEEVEKCSKLCTMRKSRLQVGILLSEADAMLF